MSTTSETRCDNPECNALIEPRMKPPITVRSGIRCFDACSWECVGPLAAHRILRSAERAEQVERWVKTVTPSEVTL